MKHTAKLNPQRAYVTRRADFDNSLWTQEEAERLALIDGDHEEAKRRRDAAMDLKSKKRQATIAPIPFGIIRELGSRDAIGNMLKTRCLEERHGRTTLQLRDYMVAREVTMGGSGNLIFVEGSQASGIESKLYALQRAAQAVSAGERSLPGAEFIRPVTGLVCGHVTLPQAAGRIRGRAQRVQDELRDALKRYLEAAEPFFGGG